MIPKPPYKYYLLGLLTVIAIFNFLDRYVLSLMLEPIKQEFSLSDSELGFLTGFAFALFYALAGIPIARWADQGNRNIVVTVTTGLWSLMVAISALVGSYSQLLLVRVGVAVGEAGCLPTAQSLIADYYDRIERPRAMAIYCMYGPLAVVVGYLGGGWLIDAIGWRLTFVVIGLPGILLAFLAKITLREPRFKKSAAVKNECPSLLNVFETLWRQNTYRQIVMAFCVSYFFGMGIMQWIPTFFIRSHGMAAGEVGTWLAFVWGVCGICGTYLGGSLATKYAAGKEALQMRAVAIIFIIYGILFVLVCLSSDKYYAMALMAVGGFLSASIGGPIFSAIQSLVNQRMRSVSLALVFLLSNLIGFGVGPLAVGVVSDLFSIRYGSESLRYALMSFSPGFLWVAYFYWKAGITIETDIDFNKAE